MVNPENNYEKQPGAQGGGEAEALKDNSENEAQAQMSFDEALTRLYNYIKPKTGDANDDVATGDINELQTRLSREYQKAKDYLDPGAIKYLISYVDDEQKRLGQNQGQDPEEIENTKQTLDDLAQIKTAFEDKLPVVEDIDKRINERMALKAAQDSHEQNRQGLIDRAQQEAIKAYEESPNGETYDELPPSRQEFEGKLKLLEGKFGGKSEFIDYSSYNELIRNKDKYPPNSLKNVYDLIDETLNEPGRNLVEFNQKLVGMLTWENVQNEHEQEGGLPNTSARDINVSPTAVSPNASHQTDYASAA
jgi:hypothetical protein